VSAGTGDVHGVDEFFGELGRREFLPALAGLSGTIRFDLIRDGEVDHWMLAIERGKVRVSRENAAADCSLRADTGLIESILTGRTNALAAYLRGAVDATGSTEMLVHLRRIFPAAVPARAGSDASEGQPSD
jgi:hypothetical protein